MHFGLSEIQPGQNESNAQLLTITLSVGLSLLGGSVVLWLEGGYGRSPAGVAFGASGWLLASILVGRFIPTIDVADMLVVDNTK